MSHLIFQEKAKRKVVDLFPAGKVQDKQSIHIQ